MMNDEIIVELRASKLKLAEQAGFDMQRLGPARHQRKTEI
jgi:hypothetical protein